jgi:magnesium chelatase family protein
MLCTTTSFILDGISARDARIEVDVNRGLPGFAVVGLPAKDAAETRERVRAALVNSGFEFPLRRIVVNISPPSLRGAGPSMDLAIATALLVASAQLHWPGIDRVAFVGELALDGRVRPVDGALVIAEAARRANVTTIVVPVENGSEAALAGPIEVVPVADVAGLAALRSGVIPPAPERLPLPTGPAPEEPDLADLRGQPKVRLALEIAAAGGHGLLLVGAQGVGASLAASRLPSILPPLSEAEAMGVVRIAGATGRLGPGVLRGRPFRAPHHAISAAGLLGGGKPIRPGEVTLAHRGVLYLGEVGQFRRDVIDQLAQALDARMVTVDRGGVTRRFPCDLLLVAASAACPCGRAGDDCVCRPVDVCRFEARMTRGLGDHLPLRVRVAPPTPAEIAGPPEESSAEVRERVVAARERANVRLGAGRTNADMTEAEVAALRLTNAAANLFAADLACRPRLRGRRGQTLRLARTAADLGESEFVGLEAMQIALALRGEDRPEAAG